MPESVFAVVTAWWSGGPGPGVVAVETLAYWWRGQGGRGQSMLLGRTGLGAPWATGTLALLSLPVSEGDRWAV